MRVCVRVCVSSQGRGVVVCVCDDQRLGVCYWARGRTEKAAQPLLRITICTPFVISSTRYYEQSFERTAYVDAARRQFIRQDVFLARHTSMSCASSPSAAAKLLMHCSPRHYTPCGANYAERHGDPCTGPGQIQGEIFSGRALSHGSQSHGSRWTVQPTAIRMRVYRIVRMPVT